MLVMSGAVDLQAADTVMHQTNSIEIHLPYLYILYTQIFQKFLGSHPKIQKKWVHGFQDKLVKQKTTHYDDPRKRMASSNLPKFS